MRNVLFGLFLFFGSSLYAQDTTRVKEVKRVDLSFIKTALVFVQKADSTWEPRMIQIGIADYDYTEIISGLKEGERVALLSATIMQAQRVAASERLSQSMGSGNPLGGTSTIRPRN